MFTAFYVYDTLRVQDEEEKKRKKKKKGGGDFFFFGGRSFTCNWQRVKEIKVAQGCKRQVLNITHQAQIQRRSLTILQGLTTEETSNDGTMQLF